MPFSQHFIQAYIIHSYDLEQHNLPFGGKCPGMHVSTSDNYFNRNSMEVCLGRLLIRNQGLPMTTRECSSKSEGNNVKQGKNA